jgi:hypothetical protein
LEYKHMNKKVSKEKVVIYDTSKFGAFKIWLQVNNTDINTFISEKICSKDSVLPKFNSYPTSHINTRLMVGLLWAHKNQVILNPPFSTYQYEAKTKDACNIRSLAQKGLLSPPFAHARLFLYGAEDHWRPTYLVLWSRQRHVPSWVQRTWK